jgi:hypothetical protein
MGGGVARGASRKIYGGHVASTNQLVDLHPDRAEEPRWPLRFFVASVDSSGFVPGATLAIEVQRCRRGNGTRFSFGLSA